MGDVNWQGLWNGTLAAARGLAFFVLSLGVALPLAIVTTVALALVPIGVGALALPFLFGQVRRFANLHRRLAARWSDVDIPEPYRPLPRRRFRALLTDPATWRDFLWLWSVVPVGCALGLVPSVLFAYAIEGILVAPALVAFYVPWYGYGVIWPIEDPIEAILCIPQGLLFLAIQVRVGPWLIGRLFRFDRALLAPSALAQRVQQLTETRAETVDAQAAELRRIERDLHDGAQARLVSLSMSIGLAEELLARDPDTARRLLTEAREASGQALTELRDLVRGIHPPVLAERGLTGAVKALALALPLPVAVNADLPGRAEAPLESAAYFAVAEALANVTKHSRADRAWVSLDHRDGRLTMAVGDNGSGGADPSGGGLAGIRRRLAAFDGTMTVVSPPGGPTVVTMELPCALSSPKTSPSSGTG